jgi:hypothetical protein
VFGLEDKFRHLLLLRFERLGELHYVIKSFAFAMINLHHYRRSARATATISALALWAAENAQGSLRNSQCPNRASN